MTKRPIWVYGDDGRGGPRWMARIILVLAYVFVMAWAFCATFIREVGRAFYYAYLEVGIAHSEIAQFWNMEEPKR